MPELSLWLKEEDRSTPVQIDTEPFVAFRILKACKEAGLVLDVEENGIVRPLSLPKSG